MIVSLALIYFGSDKNIQIIEILYSKNLNIIYLTRKIKYITEKKAKMQNKEVITIVGIKNSDSSFLGGDS